MASAPRHLRIFLASPGDVAAEREIALRVLDDLPYDPLVRGRITVEDVAWDKRGAGAPILAGVTPQDSIAAGLPRPSECDIVVVIFWSRMGTPLPSPQYQKPDGSRYESGTEWEYADAVTAFRTRGGPYVLLYRRKQPVLLNADDPDFEERRAQYEKVKRFFGALRDADGSATSGYTEYEVPGDFRQLFEHDLKSLVARILEKPDTGPMVRAALPEPWKGSPFPGLRAFTAADAAIFFGREREIDALVARVPEHRFIAVVGASGSGKSSLIAAGVIPRLQLTAGSAGDQPWLLLHLTPDRLGTSDPFASLAAAILHALPQTQQKGLAAKLRENPELLASLLPPQTLVFVDQFEELFTTIQPSLRTLFVDALGRVHAIITVRADFYGYCVEMPALARLVENGTFPLAAPGIAALYDMITRPAARAALTFEEGLPQRILDDTGQEPGALALMAYTLDELYRRSLTHAAYEELGGVQGAIGKRSESVFSNLDEAEKAALPRVFRELVDIDERGTATRQRASLVRVAATRAAQRLTDALTNARLLVQSRGDDNEPVVEVAHEALFRSWSRLAEWIEEAREDLRLLGQVRMAAVEWNRSGRRDDFLWSHERLAPVYAVRDRMGVEFDKVAAEFIRPEYDRIGDKIRTQRGYYRQRPYIERLAAIGAPAAKTLVECLQYTKTQSAQADLYRTLARFSSTAVPHLLEAISSRAFKARVLAMEALARVEPAAATHLIADLLHDPDTEVRAGAVRLAARTRQVVVVPSLCMALEDPACELSVRQWVVVALATFASRSALAGLLRALQQEHLRFRVLNLLMFMMGDVSVRQEIDPDELQSGLLRLIAGNGILRDAEAAATVVVTLKPFLMPNKRVSPEVLFLLGQLRHADATRAILRTIPNAGSDDLNYLFRALTQRAEPLAVQELIGLLEADRPIIRAHAVAALGEIAHRVAEGSLSVEGELRDALIQPLVVKRLNAFKSDPDRNVRRGAMNALAEVQRLLHRRR